jgi:hypothetical protein
MENFRTLKRGDHFGRSELSMAAKELLLLSLKDIAHMHNFQFKTIRDLFLKCLRLTLK